MVIAPDRDKKPHGKAVIAGAIQYLSVSQIQTFDVGTDGGCPRKWYYDKVVGLPRASTEAQNKGTKAHSELEHYLKTGEDVLSPMVRAGRRFIPKPMVHLLVEHAFTPRELDVRGIPMVGYIDVVNESGYYLTDQGEEIAEDAPEVIDWKTTKDFAYAKSAASLRDTIQMVTYAEWVRRRRELPLGFVRISHGVFLTKGAPAARKVTTTIGVSEIASKWERVQATVDAMKVAATAPNPTDVEPNYDACEAFRGCDYRSVCPRSKFAFLKGDNKAMGLMDRFLKKESEPTVTPARAEGINPPDGNVDPAKAAAPLPEEVLATMPPEIKAAAAPFQPPLPTVQHEPMGGSVTEALEKKKRGRPAKVKAEVTREEVAAAVKESIIPYVGREAATPFANGRELYVDVIMSGIPSTDLDGYIRGACKKLEENFAVVDIRCAPQDNPLGYMKWRGVLAAYVREFPPGPGVYHISDVRESEIKQIVVEALNPLCQVFVRGR